MEKYPISPALYDAITSPDSVVAIVGAIVILGNGLTIWIDSDVDQSHNAVSSPLALGSTALAVMEYLPGFQLSWDLKE